MLLQTLEVADSLVELVYAGLTQILQRKPASKWEKDAAGYDKRPSGFERNTIPFNGRNAEGLQIIMQEAVKQWATIEVVEYVPEEKVGKYKEEVEIIGRHESADDVESWLADTIKFDGEYVDETTDSGYSIAVLQAVNAYKRNWLKTQM